MALLVLVFLVFPIAELAVLISVGRAIGVLDTIGLLILVSAVGAWLAKHQGTGVLARQRHRAAEVVQLRHARALAPRRGVLGDRHEDQIGARRRPMRTCAGHARTGHDFTRVGAGWRPPWRRDSPASCRSPA